MSDSVKNVGKIVLCDLCLKKKQFGFAMGKFFFDCASVKKKQPYCCTIFYLEHRDIDTRAHVVDFKINFQLKKLKILSLKKGKFD